MIFRQLKARLVKKTVSALETFDQNSHENFNVEFLPRCVLDSPRAQKFGGIQRTPLKIQRTKYFFGS